MSDESSIEEQLAESANAHLESCSTSSVAQEGGSWSRLASRNLAALAFARIFSTATTLVLTAYLTRVLEPSAYGILGFGTALLSYFILFTRLGFDVVGIREIARYPEKAAELTGVITSLQLLLSVTAYVFYAALVLLLPKDGLFKLVLLVQGIALFAQAISMEWVYQGVQRMGVLAMRIVAIGVVHLAAVLVIVHSPDDVILAAAAQAGALLLLNIWLLVIYIRDFGPLNLRIDVERWRKMLPSTLSIAASAFMVGVFYNVDLVMLGLFRSEAEVGLYSACVRALTASLIPAMVICQSFFPALAHAQGDTEKMRERGRLFAATMLPTGIPLSATAALLAGPLIVLLAGPDYAPASTTLCLLMANTGIAYVNMTLGHAIIAWNRERSYMVIVGIGALFDIVLNLLLIPRYGIVGAATTTLAAQFVLLVGLATVHFRMVNQVYVALLARTVLATLAGVVIPIGIASRFDIPLLPTLVLVGGAYTAAAFAFRLFEFRTLRALFASSNK